RLREGTGTADRSVVALAKDARGYGNLCRLLTDAHMSGERGDPALTTGQVCARAEGLVCLLGPESEQGALAVTGCPDAALAGLGPWREAFGRDLFVEIRDHREPQSRPAVRR